MEVRAANTLVVCFDTEVLRVGAHLHAAVCTHCSPFTHPLFCGSILVAQPRQQKSPLGLTDLSTHVKGRACQACR